MRPVLVLGTCTVLAASVGAARASQTVRPGELSSRIRSLRATVDHYRTVTWVYDRAARRDRTSTSYSYRRSRDPRYLAWTVAVWERRAFRSRKSALLALRKRLGLVLPLGPGPHASTGRLVAYSRELTLSLRRIYPGRRVSRSPASARGPRGGALLRAWELRAASATAAVSGHATRVMLIGPQWLTEAFLCIHRYEAGWQADTGNGYYGGMQMDAAFMRRYGADFVRRWGTADRWPVWAQLEASVRAYRSGRGFRPWPSTARVCGLL